MNQIKSDIVFPAGKKDIYDYRDRQDIVNVVIPDGVRNIGSGCFSNCRNLRYVYIPDSVTEIGLAAFENCKNFEVVEGCKGVKKILSRAFDGTRIKSITLPKNVAMIDGYGFYGFCFGSDALESIDFYTSGGRGGWRSVDGVLVNGPQVVVFPAAKKGSYTISGENKKIHNYAFYHSSLDEILIEEGVEIIGFNCFDGCRNLTKIVLPKTLKSIESEAFANCKKLEEVIFQGESVEFGKYVFDGCKKLRRLVLPPAILGNKDWMEAVPANVEVSYLNSAQISKEEFVSALKAKDPHKAKNVIAGIECGYARSVSAEEIRRALKAKNNLPYFYLCGDMLRELGEYDGALEQYFFSHEDFDLILDCLEKAKDPTLFQLNTISFRLATLTGLAKKDELTYSYMDSDSDENPWDPTHWEVYVTNYKRAFEIVKEAASNGHGLCKRFLSLVPQDYEGRIENTETYAF